MNMPVNALEVIERELRVANDYRVESGSCGATEVATEAGEALAAVAKLIEAGDRLERRTVEHARLTSSVFNSDMESLRTALARVKGGAA